MATNITSQVQATTIVNVISTTTKKVTVTLAPYHTGEIVTGVVCGVLFVILVVSFIAVIVHYRMIRKSPKHIVNTSANATANMGQCAATKQKYRPSQFEQPYTTIDRTMLPNDLVNHVQNPGYSSQAKILTENNSNLISKSSTTSTNTNQNSLYTTDTQILTKATNSMIDNDLNKKNDDDYAYNYINLTFNGDNEYEIVSLSDNFNGNTAAVNNNNHETATLSTLSSTNTINNNNINSKENSDNSKNVNAPVERSLNSTIRSDNGEYEVPNVNEQMQNKHKYNVIQPPNVIPYVVRTTSGDANVEVTSL